MLDQDLFKELVKKKILEQTVADRVLRDANLAKKSAEEILYQEKLADEIEVAKVKSELIGAPYKKIDIEAISSDLISLIPNETAKTHRVIPLEKKDGLLIVGMLRPDDTEAQEAVKFIAKKERLSLGVYIVTPSDLTKVWRKYLPYQNEVEAAVKDLGFKGEDEEKLIAIEEGAKSAEEAPVIRIVVTILRQAVEAGASDIHIEPQRLRSRVRYRIDGKLNEVASLPLTLQQAVVSRVKVLTSLRLDESRVPQDGRFRSIVSGRPIDFRVSTFPTPQGEKLAIRVLDSTTGLKGLKEIGLSDYNFGILNEAINAPFGMILITGPTGSGKSTTLYGIMQKINSPEVNVITLEDPVEYFMEGVNQSQVKPEIGYTFASGLRQILRQDPDVIMVGEIRDGETAALAVNAALTGHIMLSTLHTNNALGVVPRLVDLGVPAFLLPSSLNVMLAQRLVIRLCPDCKKETKAPPEIQAAIEEAFGTLPSQAKSLAVFKPPYVIFHSNTGTQCKTCKGKGTLGRISIMEIFRMTKELANIISAGFTANKLAEESKRQGMVTLRQDGIIKALEGKVLIEEVMRETNE